MIFCSYKNRNIGSFRFSPLISTILLGGEQIAEDKHVHFGLAIKNARMDCGLTQEALAERAQLIHMLESWSEDLEKKFFQYMSVDLRTGLYPDLFFFQILSSLFKQRRLQI